MDLSDGSETFKKDASFKYLSTSEKYTFWFILLIINNIIDILKINPIFI